VKCSDTKFNQKTFGESSHNSSQINSDSDKEVGKEIESDDGVRSVTIFV